MAWADIRRLWTLSGIDSAITLLKGQAANLDVGQREAASLAELEKQDSVIGAQARELGGEQMDLELKQKGIEDKLAKINKTMFGGTVTNPREVDAYEKEIVMLKRQLSQIEDRLLELMDIYPPAKVASDELSKKMDLFKSTIAKKRQAAVVERTRIESAYKAEIARRAEAAKAVSVPLLSKYEGIRARQNGIGMAQITQNQTCGACGTLLPERTLQSAKDERVVTCENCHRILYYTEGLI